MTINICMKVFKMVILVVVRYLRHLKAMQNGAFSEQLGCDNIFKKTMSATD